MHLIEVCQDSTGFFRIDVIRTQKKEKSFCGLGFILFGHDFHDVINEIILLQFY
jgi:hypothetical protein